MSRLINNSSPVSRRMALGWRGAENQHGIKSAKSEGIGHSIIDGHIAPHIGDVVQVTVWISFA